MFFSFIIERFLTRIVLLLGDNALLLGH